jgi:hypothetical protein
MKEFIKETIIIDKNINKIFELLYDKNEEILANILNLLEYKKGVWTDINKRVDMAKVIFDDLPDILAAQYFNNNKTFIIKAKTFITINTQYERNIITKYKLKNDIILLKIANILKLIKIKNIINLKYINHNQTAISIKTKIRMYDNALEEFGIVLYSKILENTILELNKNHTCSM